MDTFNSSRAKLAWDQHACVRKYTRNAPGLEAEPRAESRSPMRKNPPSICSAGFFFITSLTITYFHTGRRCITGAKSFHGPVRGRGRFRAPNKTCCLPLWQQARTLSHTDGLLSAYCVEKLGKVKLWKENLTGSTDQNRRYQAISNRLDV